MYIHNLLKDGYTNENQVLGSGSGLGNDVQTFSISLNKQIDNLKKASKNNIETSSKILIEDNNLEKSIVFQYYNCSSACYTYRSFSRAVDRGIQHESVHKHWC